MAERDAGRGSRVGEAYSARAGEDGLSVCFGSRRSPVQVRPPRPDQVDQRVAGTPYPPNPHIQTGPVALEKQNPRQQAGAGETYCGRHLLAGFGLLMFSAS